LAVRTGREIREISPDALTALYDYDYPGNVRELMNILERAFVLCHEEQIDPSHLPPELTASGGRRTTERVERHDETQPRFSEEPGGDTVRTSHLAHDGSGEGQLPIEWSSRLKPSEHKLLSSSESEPDDVSQISRGSAGRERIRPEVQRLRQALDAHHWRRGETARALGISRSTLWRRMKEYGLA
jgi:DNA-binding NtrC family response regulator